LRTSQAVTRYADCRLLAAAIQNETLVGSLREKYLVPFESGSDGGTKLRQALRAYIDAECNATSAASALKVGRHTVENRLRMAERVLGRPLRTCLAEVDLALRLKELDATGLNESLGVRWRPRVSPARLGYLSAAGRTIR
jgi:DNA-binding PucR family transcriptional regulator